MADAVASVLVQMIFERVSSSISQSVGLMKSVEKELIKLSTTLASIQAVLKDAEERQIKEKAVKIWLTKLKDIAYDAEDLLDEFILKAERSNPDGDTQLDNLKTLPKKLQNLVSLQKFEIWHCTQLQSLQEEGLPMALQNFQVLDCPLLKERCQRDAGEDWTKIEHIPYIKIDGLWISPS